LSVNWCSLTNINNNNNRIYIAPIYGRNFRRQRLMLIDRLLSLIMQQRYNCVVLCFRTICTGTLISGLKGQRSTS